MVDGKKDRNLTTGSITLGLLWFAVPMILGNLLQQFYNIADTLIVGQFLGAKALAAVGSAYTLMVFLTSVLLGLCMGSGAIFSLQYGAGDREALKRSTFVSLVLIGLVTLVLNVSVFVWIDPILRLLQVPEDVYPLMRDYLWVIFWGIGFTFIYNYYASLLRAIGNSLVPLIRMSEMYYIAAEAIYKTDLTAAKEYLLTVKEGRGLSSSDQSIRNVNAANESNFLNILQNDARREWLGEGQIFYMYKRLNQNIPSVDPNKPAEESYQEIKAEEKNFVIPMPNIETDLM